MPSVTKKIIIDDIILKVTEAHPTDDFNVPRSQISYLIDTARDELLPKAITNNIRRGKIPNSIYVEKESGKRIYSEEDGSSVKCGLRHYVTLDHDPIWVFGDNGVVLVTINNGTKVDRVRHEELDVIKFLSGAKASATSPVWVREGRRIYIDELTDIQANEMKIHVFYIPTLGFETDETVPYKLDDSLRGPVTKYVTNEIIKQVGGTTDDQIEDGVIDE